MEATKRKTRLRRPRLVHPKTKRAKRYVVRTGLSVVNRSGEMLELVFCSSGEGGWLAPANNGGARRLRCGALSHASDCLQRASCGQRELEDHEAISFADAC